MPIDVWCNEWFCPTRHDCEFISRLVKTDWVIHPVWKTVRDLMLAGF